MDEGEWLLTRCATAVTGSLRRLIVDEVDDDGSGMSPGWFGGNEMPPGRVKQSKELTMGNL
jgi:hypothetical protein